MTTASPTPFFAESAGETDHSGDANKMVAPDHSPASAAVPSEEEIAWVIMCARNNGACEVKDWAAEEVSNPHVGQALRQARAVLALFAPILAEKERRIREMAMQALADDQQLTASLDRALAAEAALETADLLLCDLMNTAGHYRSTLSEDDRDALSSTINRAVEYFEAAAIRSQGQP